MYSRGPSRRSEPHWRERQFADAQALAHVGSWERAPDSDRAAWSDELCRIFGQPLGFSATFDEFAQLIHPEDRDRVTRNLGRAEPGVVYESRYRIVRPGGEIRHVCGRAGGRSDDHGTAYTFGTIQDVTDYHEADAARREAQDLFETAFSQAPIGMALIAPDGRWLKVNRALCAITGWPEPELIQRPFREITHPADVAVDDELLELLIAGEIPGYQFEKRYVTRGGGEIWAELSKSRSVRDADGAAQHFIVRWRTSARARRPSAASEAEAEARAPTRSRHRDRQRHGRGYARPFTVRSRRSTRLSVCSPGSPPLLIGATPPYRFWPPEERDAIAAILADVVGNNGGTHELTLMRANGERFEAEITARPAREENGRALGFVSTLRDVSVQKRQQRELERLARTDSLTQLGNRHVLQEALTREAARRSHDGQQLALVLLDLDLFKQVNDAFGHPAGDSVLIEVARRLERTVRAGEVLARVGGEEFAWLLPACDAEEAVAAADRARAAIASEPFGRAGKLTMCRRRAGVDPSDGDAVPMADRAAVRGQAVRAQPDLLPRRRRPARRRAGLLTRGGAPAPL
jgi:diguanylate cyclase (GGDEF)-like protein/PAS domain S-box-containing protein